jgi:hypothetical protein
LRQVLRSRRRSLRAKQVAPPLLQPLWSRYALEDDVMADQEAALLTHLHRRMDAKSWGAISESEVCKLIERALDRQPMASAMSLLVWLTVLSEAGTVLPGPTLLAVWRATLEASLAGRCRGDGVSRASCPLDDRDLLLAGELPWRMGLCFRDVRGSGTLINAGRTHLREGLQSLTDGDGSPHAAALERLPLTLAVFARSIDAGAVAREPLWDADSAERFKAFIERAAALCQADGRIPLSNGASYATASLLRAASQLSGLPQQQASLRRMLSLPDDLPAPGRSNRQRSPQLVRRKRSERIVSDTAPSSQSDWAALACLRNNWLAGADCCIITHHHLQPQICVTAFERMLISGTWQSDVLLDGEAVARHADWTCVCWFSDEDADFLELQQETDDVTIFRQVMLSRTDHWLFLAEAARAPRTSAITLTTRLPLADGVGTDRANWTRELSLTQQKLHARLYPLGLDQQRVVHAHGTLEAAGGEIRLQHQVTGTAAYAPLMIDWSPDRQREDSQWRRLTVVEEGVVLREDQAVGYRLRIGKHQWLYYHSHQKGETARSVLGHHTPHETVIGEFTSDGNVQPLVMVE